MLFYKENFSRRLFIICNYIFLALAAAVCIFPILHVAAISLSSSAAVTAGAVVAWPVGLQLNTYKFVINNPDFYTAFGISVERALLGIIISTLLTILSAYPLSLRKNKFRARKFYVWFYLVAMLFNGGLIPTYLMVHYTGLIDSIWALVIPGAIPIFNVILLHNFFKELPDEISESAVVEGAGHWTVLTRILVPLSKPVMATLILFVAVGHWNSWFDGLIYMNHSNKYPLQSYLRTIVVEINLNVMQNISEIENISQKNATCAQIITAMLPIIIVYPFLQKYFTKGIILGSVKG
ncbi:MAG TPA: ABC transporter permease [Clostridiales bacterium]|nr:ABC transporter permease [Clostridiales bacterium]